MLTRQQKEMVQDGFPKELFRTDEQRKAWWDAHPPKAMPLFHETKNQNDPATLKLLAELEEAKKVKTKIRIHKMLSKKEDRTGQRWDAKTARWANDTKENQAVISITTNTRGSTKMAKDYAEMSLAELAAAYNKKSGLPPIKKFKDKATGLKRMAELMSKPPKMAAAESKLSDVVRKPAKVVKEGSANKRAAEFGARVGSFREKLIIALDEHFKKQVSTPDLLKAVYGSKNTENGGALTMVLKGAQTMIEKNKLPYTLKKEKNEAKELSFGLYSK